MPDAAHERLNRFRTAPNLLTLSRICLVPLLVAAVLDNHYTLSFCIFVIAGLTDAIDGLLARMLKQFTMLGQYLDPVADKLLLSTLFLVFTYKGMIPARVTALVLGRDVGILLVAALLYAAAGRREFRPSLLGKGNTLAQIAAIAAVLFQAMLLEHHVVVRWVAIFEQGALWATMALTIASGLQYSWVSARRVGSLGANGHGTNSHNSK
ncbi:MAG TPA: CDP-alcohol phosphatidyltransferase family protein [Terracidiphilus sp.]|nr:CDP-alcohol phosphatidyltransferase family protein [Terracidiphilus sp.]